MEGAAGECLRPPYMIGILGCIRLVPLGYSDADLRLPTEDVACRLSHIWLVCDVLGYDVFRPLYGCLRRWDSLSDVALGLT